MRFSAETAGLLIILLTLIVISPSVLGHKYLETGETGGRDYPVLVSDHQISWAAYESLSQTKEVDYYRFDTKAGEEIYASLLIPKIKRLRGFDPGLALIGPGLVSNEEVSAGTENSLDVREEEGFILKTYSGDGDEDFFEPFTQTSYWERQELRRNAPETGTYHLAVFHPDGSTGKYVLAIGEKEVFGPGDILGLPATWWKVRIFAERELSTYIITGAVLGGLAVGSFFLARALL